MSIYSTIKSLYAIKCEAEVNPSSEMRTLLKAVPDDEIEDSLRQLEYLLSALNEVGDNLNRMYILHYTTGTDRENKNVLFQTEVVFGNQTVKFTTQFDEKATQSMIEALGMSLAMVKAGDRLGKEGRA